MEGEKMELIQGIINDASKKEIEAMYQFLVMGKGVDGLLGFFTRNEFKQFKEEFNEVDETQIWED